MPTGLLLVKCSNSNITTGVNKSNLYLIRYMFLKKISLVDVDSSCTEQNSAFRGEDLEACKPIRNMYTLRFARLRWESETEDANCRLKQNDLDSERSLLLSSSLPNEMTEINFVLSAGNKNCTHNGDKSTHTMATKARLPSRFEV